MRVLGSLVLLVGCSAPSPGPLPPEPPLFDGPFAYSDLDAEGRFLIDVLWIVSEQAVDEIAELGQTPAEYLDWRLDDMNATLARSRIDSSRVRSVGVHVLQEADYLRTGVGIGDTAVNIANALGWLGDYREVYGADKVIIVAGTEEGASGAALGGGDVSAHWVDFLPVEHEFGHQMGGSHCYDGKGGVNFGFPAGGYTDDGLPAGGPVQAGTRMCGNSVALFSNPDLRLTLDEILAMVDDGLAPAGDWAALVEDDGRIPMGDERFADMASQWRRVERSAAEKLPATRYDGEADLPFEQDGCVALYAEEGYGALQDVVCAPQTRIDVSDVSSVRIGAGAQISLFTDPFFGAGAMCGGQVLRLASSSPSLEALSAHHGVPSLDDAVRAVAVYEPTDRVKHAWSASPYTFHGNGASPSCPGELRLMPDNRAWSATAAVYGDPVSVPFAVDFTVRSSHDDGGETPPADGMAFFFAKAADSYGVAPVSREHLGVATDGTGLAVELNVWTNTVAVRDASWEVIGDALRFGTFTDGEPVPVRIEVRADEVAVSWDGDVILRTPVAFDTTHQTVGFSAATGAYTIEYRLADIVYTPL